MIKKILVIACILSALSLTSCGGGDSNGGGGGGKAGDLFDAINTLRNNVGQPNLTRVSAIDAVAEAYAAVFGPAGTYPYADNYDGNTPQQRLTNGGVTYTSAAEQGYCQFPDSGNVNDAVSNMTQATLTSATYTRCGVAARNYY